MDLPMRSRLIWLSASLCLLAGLSGCSMTRPHRSLASAEPAYVAGDPAIAADVPVARPVTVVDRHPLFYKPREYYETSGNNRFVKVGAATLIGIPAGIIGEMRQIVVGQPSVHY
jgi:hypothetical protein